MFAHVRPQDLADAFFQSSPLWYWRVFLLLVGWLHLFFHLSHAGCALILKILPIVLVAVAVLPSDTSVPVTLRTGLRRLKFKDKFEIHPVCVNCRIFHPTRPDIVFCVRCAEPLYKTSSAGRSVPYLQCPQQRLTNAINDFVWEGKNEFDADLWRTECSVPGIKSRIQDGRVWQTAPAHGGGLFFDNSQDREAPEELRLGITLGFDG